MSGQDDSFSYRGALQELRTRRVQPAEGDGQQEEEQSTSTTRKVALMQKLQDGNGPQSTVTVDRCVFQSIKIDKNFGFLANLAPEDADGDTSHAEAQSKRKNGSTGYKKPFEISIPLSSDRVKLADVKKSLKSEYAARYCEALGVSPTQQNMNLIHKNMPLDKCKLTQVFQPGLGRGERRNHVAVQPAHHSPRVKMQTKSAVAPFQVLPRQTSNDVRERQRQASGANRNILFENYKKKFVYPYNLQERFDTGAKEPVEVDEKPPSMNEKGAEKTEGERLVIHDALVAKLNDVSGKATKRDLPKSSGVTVSHMKDLESMLAPDGESTSEPVVLPSLNRTETKSREDAVFVGKEHIDTAIQRELDQQSAEFDRNAVVATMQQIVGDFPWENMTNPKDQTEATRAKAFLLSGTVQEAVMLLLRFLFVAYVAPLSRTHSEGISPNDKDGLFVDTYAAFVDIVEQRVGKTRLPLDLPLLILLLRVTVESENRSRYPTFFDSAVGARQLEKMDAFSMAMLDPLGLVSRIPSLESSPQALRVLHTKRFPPRFTPTTTTPMTQFILGDSVRSAEAKALLQTQPLVARGLSELKEHLSPMVRSRLLNVMMEKKLHSSAPSGAL